MLEINNISKTYNKNTMNKKEVFKNLSLTVADNDFITIIGSNGSGKSTLFNLISKTDFVDDGSLILDKENLNIKKEYEVMKKISRVYQNPDQNVALELNVLENIFLSLNKNKKYNLTFCIKKNKIEKIKEDLSKINLGLESSLYTKTKYLSGGQRQALSLYMATITNPKLLLLDEHTAALDPKTCDVILDLTNELVKEKKITTIMITHNLNQAIKYGNRIIMLHDGKIVIDLKNEEKNNLTIEELLKLFDRVKIPYNDESLFERKKNEKI